MNGEIVSVTTSEGDGCLCLCIIRRYRSEILVDWAMIGKDTWNSEGRMSCVSGDVKFQRFNRNDLMDEIYSHYKNTVGVAVAKQNMTVFAKYLQKEES